ncbi:hypothetical protein B0H13DRAFT_2009295, partial [Mycena leptocephala]
MLFRPRGGFGALPLILLMPIIASLTPGQNSRSEEATGTQKPSYRLSVERRLGRSTICRELPLRGFAVRTFFGFCTVATCNFNLKAEKLV